MRTLHIVSLCLLCCCLLSVGGCTMIDSKVLGNSYKPTTDVLVFYSEKDVPPEYAVVGRMTTTASQTASDDQINRTIRARAMEHGYDAILIEGMGSQSAGAAGYVTPNYGGGSMMYAGAAKQTVISVQLLKKKPLPPAIEYKAPYEGPK